jgi:TonB family protein
MNIRFRVTKLIAIAIMAYSVVAIRASGADRAWLNPYGHDEGTAVDAKGVTHRANDYKGNPPWMIETVHTVAPRYPERERLQRHHGDATVRLTLDLLTGLVIKAELVESTGFKALDASALAAFRRWQWKPRRWREVTTGITFRLHDTTTPLPPGAIRLHRGQ